MRRFGLAFIIIFLLQACSALDSLPFLSATNTPNPTPTVTQTPTRTPSPTQTSTPTPRDTVTPIGAPPTLTPVILVSADASGAPISVFTPTPYKPVGGFESVSISPGKIFYGVCKPNYTKMTIKVENPIEVDIVYLFFRLESGKKPGDTTPWYGTVTDNDGGGVFLYTLRANNIPERKNFIRAWVNYQFVAVDKDKNILGRSIIYTRTLVLEPCR
jgi:hypothetical protein